MTAPSAEPDKWEQSADISADAFANLMNDESLPGYENLNNSNFFDKMGNASKMFDGEGSTRPVDSIKAASRMTCRKASAPRRIKRNSTPNSVLSPQLEDAAFYLEDGIDEEGILDESVEEEYKCREDKAEEALEEALDNFFKNETQDESVVQKPVNDEKSVATTAESLSSTEESNNVSFASKNKNKYAALSQAGETIGQQDQEANDKLTSVFKKPSTGGNSHEKTTEGDQEEGDPKEATLPPRRSSRGSRKKKDSREIQDDDDNEETTPAVRRQNSRGTGAAGSKPRQRRTDADRQMGGHSSRMGDHSSRTGDHSSRMGDHSSRRERRSSIAKPNNEESTVNSRRSQRYREQRSRSFGPEHTEAAANNDGVAASPKSTPTLKRTKTLPSKQPNSVELRRVTRDPRRRRASLMGTEMLARNLSLMDQAAEALGEKKASDPSLASMMSKSSKGETEKQQTWKARRQRSIGDATDALAEKAKDAARERLARKGSIQSAAAALTTGTGLRSNVDSAMDRILQNGLENRKTNDQVSELKTDKTADKATIRDDSCVPSPTPPMTTKETPTTARRIRHRGPGA